MEARAERLVTAWVASLARERRLSPHTVRAYGATVGRFLAHVRATFGQEVSAGLLARMTVADIRGFTARRREEGLSNRSVARELAALRTFGRWLEKYHDVRIGGLKLLKGPRPKKTVPRPVAPTDIDALVGHVGELREEAWVEARDQAVLLLLYGAGLRIGEALALDADILPVGETLVIVGKGRRERMVAMLPVVREAMERYVRLCPFALGPQGPLFRGVKGGRLSPGVVRAAVRQARTTLGLPDTVSPHALRHSFASHLLARGGDLRTIQELLGHAHLSSTQIYTEVDAAHLLDVYRGTHPRGE